MSSSSVKFLNIKNFEVDVDRHCKLSVEYIVDKGVNISHHDWIAIYPHGASVFHSVNLDLMVTYEFVLSGPICKNERRYKMEFSLKGAKSLKYGHKYQFVYISRSSEIYGTSEAFQFRPPGVNDFSDQSTVSNDNDDTDTSKENIEQNLARGNNRRRKAKRRSRQLLLKVESDKSDSEDKGGSGDPGREAQKFINKFHKNKQVFVNKQIEGCPNNVHQMTPPVSPPVSCSNCYRVAGLLRAQEELYSKIKNLAEMNHELQGQVCHLQRRVELSQAACQKLSVTLMQERQAKQFYQAAAYERSEYEYQIMVVEPFVPSVLVPTVRDPPPRRSEDRARGCSFLRLKAIIGHQEEKIRSLTEEVARMKMEERQRVVAAVRDIDAANRPAEEGKTTIKEEAYSDDNWNGPSTIVQTVSF